MPSVRRAVAADEAFLVEQLSRLSDFPVPPWRTAREIADADLGILRDALHRPTDETLLLVAEEPAGRAAGFALVSTKVDYFTHAAHAHVEALAVTPAAEGRGVGRVLLDAAEQWAAARGHVQITLNVWWQNTRARGVYDRLGYQPETLHLRKAL